MIAIVDYGVGNLFSLGASLGYLGLACKVTGSARDLRDAQKIILPGVGAFEDAARKLRDTGLVPVLNEQVAAGKPLLGICLGMQLLFEQSLEFGTWQGLGYIKGSICPLAQDIPAGLKVPHIGWNALNILDRDEPMLKYSRDGEHVYYVHSFYAKDCESSVKAASEYSVMVPGMVRSGNVWGTQFHPEKSGGAGLRMLRAFGEI